MMRIKLNQTDDSSSSYLRNMFCCLSFYSSDLYRGYIIKHNENYIRFVEVDSFVYSCCRDSNCRLDEDDDDDRWPRDHNWRVDDTLR